MARTEYVTETVTTAPYVVPSKISWRGVFAGVFMGRAAQLTLTLSAAWGVSLRRSGRISRVMPNDRPVQ